MVNRCVSGCFISSGGICLIGGVIWFFVAKSELSNWTDSLLQGDFIGKDRRSITFQCDGADYGVDFYFDVGLNISCEDFPIKITGPSHQIDDKCYEGQEVEDHGTKLRWKGTVAFSWKNETGPNETWCTPGDYMASSPHPIWAHEHLNAAGSLLGTFGVFGAVFGIFVGLSLGVVCGFILCGVGACMWRNEDRNIARGPVYVPSGVHMHTVTGVPVHPTPQMQQTSAQATVPMLSQPVPPAYAPGMQQPQQPAFEQSGSTAPTV